MTQTRIATALLAFALLAVPALAADLASVEVGLTSVSFASTGERLSLAVTGPQDFAYDTELRQGGLVFEIYDADGYPLPDGTYNYELKALASAPKATGSDRDRGLGERKVAERRVQSGVFTIAGGSLVDPEAVEVDHSVAQKLVHAEDVKIQGSLCVGVDCTSGESFGFDTVRLKENNLRIKFDDTSTGSFPANDWQLTANDSANGGQNRFSIDDVTGGKTPFTIEAGAPSNSLYVADTGEVGIGTSAPVSNVEIHVKDGDTPTLRLEQDGSSGFTSQTWDVAGNEANFFVRDVTNGSKLAFRIKPGTPESTLTATSDGVGVKTWAPKTSLHVLHGGSVFTPNADTAMVLQNNPGTGEGVILSLIGDTAGNSQLAFGDTDSEFQGRIVYDHSTNDRFRFFTNGTVQMTLGNDPSGNLLTMNGGATLTNGVWTDASSRELKTNIRELSTEDAMEAFSALTPMRYNYKVNLGEENLGFIAEDVPDLVASPGRKGLAPMDIVAVLTKVLQSQQQTIDELNERLAALEGEL